MADGPSRRRKPRLWRLQFSLTSVFVLMTLSAIGVWFWYQRPYEVENKQFSSAFDPFAAPGAASGQLVQREVEYVRRVWGGGTLRHGPRRVYDGTGNLLSTENYRNGLPHGEFITYSGTKDGLETFAYGQKDGPSRQWDVYGTLIAEENYSRGRYHGRFYVGGSDGQSVIDGAFDHGQPTGKWFWFPKGGTIAGQWRDGLPDGRWEWRDGDSQVYLTIEFDRGRIASANGADLDPHLPKLLARITGEAPYVLLRLFAAIDLNFARFGPFVTPEIDIGKMSLKDFVDYVNTTSRVPLTFDVRSLEESSIAPDLQITCDVQNSPLIIALGKVLKPYDLGCDYRYGTLWVTTAESIASWKDRTGVTKLVPPWGSRLAGEWNKTTDVDFVETPLKDVADYLHDKHNGALRLDLSRLPQGPFDYRKGVVTPEIPVTMQARSVEVKNCLGILLDRIGCKASLKGETIVIEPQ